MKIIALIIGIPLVIILVVFFSWMFGNTFRKWNEGATYDDSKIQENSSIAKTMIIGFMIFIVVFWIISKTR